MSPFNCKQLMLGTFVLLSAALPGHVGGLLPAASAQEAEGAGAVAGGDHPQGSATAGSATDWAILERYCQDCHNFADYAGGVAFDILPRDTLLEDAVDWEMAVRKIRTGLMPPAGQPRPSRAVLDGFAGQLEGQLDGEYHHSANPGAAGMARLTRTQYANAVRELFAFDALPVMDKLPSEDPRGLFDNIADDLSVSPTLIEGYVSTAMRISREAVGDLSKGPTQLTYNAPAGPQTRHVEGLPLGTRGGMVVDHYFPLDAEYEIRVGSSGFGAIAATTYCDLPTVTVAINGEPVDVEDPASFRLALPAGTHSLAAALVDEQRCAGVNEFFEDYSLSGAVQSIEIHGPYNASGAGDTPSRQAIFSCYPANRDQELSCAREILGTLATRAYRRPVAQADQEMEVLMAFYQQGTEQGGFEVGVQHALARMLIDPRFLYRMEEEPADLAAGEVYPVSDLDLASRLSFFLWSSIPDDELLELASRGELSDPATLEAQVTRMLNDPRVVAMVDNFASQWLHLRDLDDALPQDSAFNDRLREAFREETELLFKDLIQEDLSVLHLLTTDYTYLNQQLAEHYGIPGVRGDYMRRVTLPEDSPRRGILGHGSILTATSVANRTSPVIRGEWIVDNFLGAPVPVPPPGVEADLSEATIPAGRTPRTLRERLEMHLENPACASCHQVMDPIGFALENFDLVGRWRETENGYPLDTTATLVDGTPITGPQDMRLALLDRSESLMTSFTEKLLSYALGRELAPHDMRAVRQIVSEARDDNYRFSAIVHGVVRSVPFMMKMKSADDSASGSLLSQLGE